MWGFISCDPQGRMCETVGFRRLQMLGRILGLQSANLPLSKAGLKAKPLEDGLGLWTIP